MSHTVGWKTIPEIKKKKSVLNVFENNVLSLEVLLYGRLKIDFENQSQIA